MAAEAQTQEGDIVTATNGREYVVVHTLPAGANLKSVTTLREHLGVKLNNKRSKAIYAAAKHENGAVVLGARLG